MRVGNVDPDIWELYPDADGDTFAGTADCDETSASTNVCATDIENDGIDQDCDGTDELDTDGDLDDDGRDGIDAGGSDCDDTDPDVRPGADDGVDPCETTTPDASTGGATGCGSAAWVFLLPLGLGVRRRSGSFAR